MLRILFCLHIRFVGGNTYNILLRLLISVRPFYKQFRHKGINSKLSAFIKISFFTRLSPRRLGMNLSKMTEAEDILFNLTSIFTFILETDY